MKAPLKLFFILSSLSMFYLPLKTQEASREKAEIGKKDLNFFKDKLLLRSMINYPEFQDLASKIQPIREKRLIDWETFIEYAKDQNTIILDSRSVNAFKGRHIKSAINIPFSDFTSESLQECIESKDVRILIYCNNNFHGDYTYMVGKLPPLALNIPTFINLYGYGYENIYELKGAYDVNDPEIDKHFNAIKSLALKKIK